MDTSEQHLQRNREISQMGTSPAGNGERCVTSLLNPAAFQNYISVVVTSCIAYASYNLVPLEERSDVIKDVSQNTWLKLLSTANSSAIEIISPRGYISVVAHSESIDEIRRRKRKHTFPLPVGEDGEMLQGNILLTTCQGMRDPATEYELKEFITEIIEAVVQLPPKQRYAVICALKDEVEHTFPLAEVFRAQGIDIDSIHWPREPKELQRVRSLLSVARKTLREQFNRSDKHASCGKLDCSEERKVVPTPVMSTSRSDHKKKEA